MAMTVFGAQQARELVREPEEDADEGSSGERVAGALDQLSADTEKHLRKRASSVYEAGDKFQSEVVDLVFDSVNADEWKPRRVVERTADLVEKSAEALRDAVGEETEATDEVDPTSSS